MESNEKEQILVFDDELKRTIEGIVLYSSMKALSGKFKKKELINIIYEIIDEFSMMLSSYVDKKNTG